MDVGASVDAALDTVAEESDNELRHNHSSTASLQQAGAATDISSIEDEVLSVIIVMLVDFFSSKIKSKIEEDLGKTEYEEIRGIIHCLGHAMGFEVTLTDNWRQPKKMSPKAIRYIFFCIIDVPFKKELTGTVLSHDLNLGETFHFILLFSLP